MRCIECGAPPSGEQCAWCGTPAEPAVYVMKGTASAAQLASLADAKYVELGIITPAELACARRSGV